MKIALTFTCLAVSLAGASYAAAARSAARPGITNREVVACMSQRMAASRKVTYNEAAALCLQPRVGGVVKGLPSDRRPAA